MCQDTCMAKLSPRSNQLAKLIVDIATGEAADEVSPKKRAATVRGRRGGSQGWKSKGKEADAFRTC